MSAPPGELNFKIDHLMQYAAVNKFLTRNVQGRKYLCIAAGDVLVKIKCAMTLLTYRKTLYAPSRVPQHLWWLIYRAEYLLRKMTAFTAVLLSKTTWGCDPPLGRVGNSPLSLKIAHF